jgi:septum formation protein
MQKIILATKSPYRKEAFACLSLNFVIEGSEVDENFSGRPDDPKELVVELAKRKAEFVAKNYEKGIVIGFDSIGWFEGKILEKPKDRQESFERLKILSGKTHYFYTGIHIINIEKNTTKSEISETEITLRDITEAEINKYLDQDPNFNTYAIGFDPLGHYSMSFAIDIKGSYNNYLRGIPLELIVKMLKEAGYEI